MYTQILGNKFIQFKDRLRSQIEHQLELYREVSYDSNQEIVQWVNREMQILNDILRKLDGA